MKKKRVPKTGLSKTSNLCNSYNFYKTIIEKFWTKSPEVANDDFKNFEEIFSVDIGLGFNSKSDKTKWLSLLNTYRNNYAHDGSKEKGLTKEEVGTLEQIHRKLITESC